MKKKLETRGRKSLGRTANLPRIRPESYSRLLAIREKSAGTVAGTLERIIAETPLN